MSITITKTALGTSLLTLVLALAGCISPGAGGSGSPLTAGELDARLDDGPARLEVHFRGPGGSIDEIHLSSEVAHDEYLESTITGADASAGTIDLALGEVTVGVLAGARTRADQDGDLARDVFFARLEASLASGAPAFVRVSRPALGASRPEAVFRATEVRIEDRTEAAKMELVAGGDNFGIEGGVAVLRVLNRVFEADGAFIGTGDVAGDDDGPLHDLGDDHGTDL